MVAVGEEINTLDFSLGEKRSAMVGMIGPISTIGIARAVLMPIYTLTGAFS